jgi:hypothetical protein
VTDLDQLEGNPTSRADPGLASFGAEVHPLRGWFRVNMQAPADSGPGTAMTAVVLLGTGAFLGACGLVAGDLWRFPSAVSAIVTALMFVSPVITYIGLRRRG